MENFLKLLFPSKCLFCDQYGDVFCSTCLRNCNTIKPPLLRPLCFFKYGGLVRKCIQKSKYSSRQFSALRLLTKHGINMFAEHRLERLYHSHLVVPIPLSRKKSSQRGFNQAELIAKELAKGYKLSLHSGLLVRARETQSQFGLNRKQRFKNLSGAFVVPTHQVANIKNKRILLVDDVLTSGATFKEASRALMFAGAKEVKCFALAKALLNVQKNGVIPLESPQYAV